MSNSNLHQKSVKQFYSNVSPCIMESIDPNINTCISPTDNASGDTVVTNKYESLNIRSEDLLSLSETNNGSFLLLDGNECMRVTSENNFLKRLKIDRADRKIKVVSVFGNTGEGKSYTLNKVFFNGEQVFRTSPEQTSCTLGVWAAYDPLLKVICLDTEGLLGVTKKENQRTRLLLKILAVSDIIIYRTKAERLQRDMYSFLGGASQAYKEHFEVALKQMRQNSDADQMSSLGPSVIIFHETTNTHTLQSSAGVSESPEDILRSSFARLELDVDAFSSLKYVGVQTKQPPTSFVELKNAIQLELDNTSVRSARNPKFIYLTLKGLNDKFNSEITNSTPQLYLPAYFTCQMKCQSCSTGCTLSMGHVDEGKAHLSPNQCQYQHQYQNCIYLCKKCYTNGERVVVKPSELTGTDKSWTSLLTYVWSGYVIECRKCGEIYRSREHWYGNKKPEDAAVIPEYVHIWPGEKNFFGSQNSARRILDSVSTVTEAMTAVGAPPVKAIASYYNAKTMPNYWTPNEHLRHCHKCKTLFSSKVPIHHCRACGKGFCDACSSRSQPVPSKGWYTDVRVCDDCYREIPPSLSQSADDSEVIIRKYSEAVVNTMSTVASYLEVPKSVIKEKLNPPYWTLDKDCLNCECCGNPFGPVIPLHHCRDCGKGVCDDCSNSRKPVPLRGWNEPVRVCDKCAT